MTSRATFFIATLLALPLAALQSAAQTNGHITKTVSVSATKQWTDTGVDLRAGDKVTLAAEGTIQFRGDRETTPDGLPRGWKDLLRALPVNESGNGALIGRISNDGQPFVVGASREITAAIGGRLFLGINQLDSESSSGEFTVKVSATRSSDTNAAAVAELTPPLSMLQEIPRRVEDREGRKGDLVNFLVVGTKEQLEKTFSDGGWVIVDRTKTAAVFDALVSTLEKQAYVEMPMSELYMFGRAQDYGYAHAEPIKVVSQRHHLRLWQSAQTFRGQPIWVGAATHDIGFERDQRKAGAVTHKIDPNIDLEREYVRATLSATGRVVASGFLAPSDPFTETQTATGGVIKSDGRILVLQLR